MKKILALFGLLLILLIAIPLAQNFAKNKSFPLFKKTTVTVNNQTFKITVAKTAKEKEIGLSEKESLSQDEGMLFLFDKPDYYFFWMKNMKFPIDIIYIRDRHIVTIFKNIQPAKSKEENPPIYKSEEPADSVLEINAELSGKYNMQKGDEVTIEGL